MTLPQVRLSLPAGDEATVALQGAHVLSWKTAEGLERLYLSPQAVLDGKSPIRGGIPVCFPQFNQRALAARVLPKHGFARTVMWTLKRQTEALHCAQAVLRLTTDATLRASWPHAFEATLTVTLTPGALSVEFAVTNTDGEPWPFALALHSYLRVHDIAQVKLTGLANQPYWDAVAHLTDPTQVSYQGVEPLCFDGETDRVYTAAGGPLTLAMAEGLRIEQSANFTETVVWNPGAALAAQMPDLPNDGFRHMLCVEAAKINAPVVLFPGQTWTASQSLTAL
jgi:glucose-6-phosphate 1-epimerase